MDCLDSPQNKNEKKESDLTEDKTLPQATISAGLAKEVSKDVVTEKPFAIPRYNLTERIGRGTFGEVWKAVQTKTGQDVAVKVFTRKETMDMGYLGREVDKLRRIAKHPYIMTLLDADIGADNPFYVMYILPKSLKKVIGDTDYEAGEHGKKEFVEQAVKWFTEACEALAYMHNKGIFHCDIKPANMLIDENDNVRLADFGQSQISGERSSALGTLWFMPPEQTDPDAVPEASWDIYSLGATMYYLLTGKRPSFTEKAEKELEGLSDTGDRLQKYKEIIRSTPLIQIKILNPKVDGDLASIIENSLSQYPKRQYKNIGQILDDINNRALKKPISCRIHSIPYLIRCFLRQYRTAIIAISIILIMITLSFFYIARSRNEAIKAAKEEKIAKNEAQFQLANFYFNKGHEETNKSGNMSEGLIWYAKALSILPENKAYKISTGYAFEAMVFKFKPIINKKLIGFGEFSNDWSLFATFSVDLKGKKEIQVLETKSVEPVSPPIKIEHSISSISFSPDKKRIAVAFWEKPINVWNIHTGKLILSISSKKRNKNFISIEYSDDGKSIHGMSASGSSYTWDSRTGKLLSSRKKDYFSEEIRNINLDIKRAYNNGDFDIKKFGEKRKNNLLLTKYGGFKALLSPNNKYFMTAFKGGLKIWDAKTNLLLSCIRNSEVITFATFSQDGESILICSGHNAQIFNTKTGVPVSPKMKHSKKILKSSFTSDKTIILTGSKNYLNVWNIKTGHSTVDKINHDKDLKEACISPNNRWILAKSEETAQIYDTITGNPVSPPMISLDGIKLVFRISYKNWDTTFIHNNPLDKVWHSFSTTPLCIGKSDQFITDASFSPDGRRVLTTSKLANTMNEKYTKKPDGKWVLTESQGNIALIWNATNGKRISPPLKHEDIITSASFSYDGKLVVTTSKDRTARIWDASTGIPVCPPIERGRVVEDAYFRPDNRSIIIVESDRFFVASSIFYRDIKNWPAFLASLKPPTSKEKKRIFNFLEDRIKKEIISLPSNIEHKDYEKFTIQWNTSLGLNELIKRRDFYDKKTFANVKICKKAQDLLDKGVENMAQWEIERFNCLLIQSIYPLLIYRDNRNFYCIVWDIRKKRALSKPINVKLFKKKDKSYRKFGSRLSLDRKYYCAENGVYSIWNGKPKYTPRKKEHDKTRRGTVTISTFSPDGNNIALVRRSDNLYIRNAKSLSLSCPPIKHDDNITWISYSPDGKMILSCWWNNARIWNAKTGEPHSTIINHNNIVKAVAFSPDGKLIATASSDKTARIWDVATGHPISPLLKHGGEVNSVSFNSTGDLLLTTCSDGIARIWIIPDLKNIPPEIVLLLAEAYMGSYIDSSGLCRNLTYEELQQRKKKLMEWKSSYGKK